MPAIRSDRFAPATREWFAEAFAAPTPAQDGAWEGFEGGDHVLVVAPTGLGQDAGGVPVSDRPAAARPPAADRERAPASSTSPRSRRWPSTSSATSAHPSSASPRPPPAAATTFREVTVGVRSGDTPQQERRRLVTHPPDILITTPESLFLMLTSAARETLRDVDTVIVDEIHAVAGTKRGAHLALSLERLDDLLEQPARRIGLSATVRPHDEVARFLGGAAPVRVVAPESEPLGSRSRSSCRSTT